VAIGLLHLCRSLKKLILPTTLCCSSNDLIEVEKDEIKIVFDKKSFKAVKARVS